MIYSIFSLINHEPPWTRKQYISGKTARLMFKFSIKYKNKGRERGECQGNSLLKTWVWNVYFFGIKHSLINKPKKNKLLK